MFISEVFTSYSQNIPNLTMVNFCFNCPVNYEMGFSILISPQDEYSFRLLIYVIDDFSDKSFRDIMHQILHWLLD